MLSLKGIIYQSGHIDFAREENQWAFRRMDAEMKTGQENRIVVKPEVAHIEIEASPQLPPEEVRWREQTESLLNTADTVYFQRKKNAMRFRRAIHEMGPNCQLITLASQEELDEYAEEYWKRIAYFYAMRHDGFRFDIGTLISLKNGEAAKPDHMELVTRLVQYEDADLPQVTFDATGSHANVQLVEWRGSVKEGETGRFMLPDTQVQLKVTMVKQPLTFCREFREEFKNYAYIFAGEKIDARLKRALKRRRSATEE